MVMRLSISLHKKDNLFSLLFGFDAKMINEYCIFIQVFIFIAKSEKNLRRLFLLKTLDFRWLDRRVDNRKLPDLFKRHYFVVYRE